MSINFKVNLSLLNSDPHIEIVRPSKTAVSEHKNNKPVSNTFLSDIQLVSNDDDMVIELCGKAMIKSNRRLLKTTAVTNKYVKTFTFGEDRLLIQIKTIEYCKIKIAIRSTAYTKLATKFLNDRS